MTSTFWNIQALTKFTRPGSESQIRGASRIEHFKAWTEAPGILKNYG